MRTLHSLAAGLTALVCTSCLQSDPPPDTTDTVVADTGTADVDDLDAVVDSTTEPDTTETDLCAIDLVELTASGQPNPSLPQYVPAQGDPCECRGHQFYFYTGEECWQGLAKCTDDRVWSITIGGCEADYHYYPDDTSDVGEE